MRLFCYKPNVHCDYHLRCLFAFADAVGLPQVNHSFGVGRSYDESRRTLCQAVTHCNVHKFTEHCSVITECNHFFNSVHRSFILWDDKQPVFIVFNPSNNRKFKAIKTLQINFNLSESSSALLRVS